MHCSEGWHGLDVHSFVSASGILQWCSHVGNEFIIREHFKHIKFKFCNTSPSVLGYMYLKAGNSKITWKGPPHTYSTCKTGVTWNTVTAKRCNIICTSSMKTRVGITIIDVLLTLTSCETGSTQTDVPSHLIYTSPVISAHSVGTIILIWVNIWVKG